MSVLICPTAFPILYLVAMVLQTSKGYDHLQNWECTHTNVRGTKYKCKKCFVQLLENYGESTSSRPRLVHATQLVVLG